MGSHLLVEGEGSGRDGEIEPTNRSLFSCRRVPCSVPALSHDCGRRHTHRRFVDFHTLANVRADNVSGSGRRYSRSSNYLSDLRSGECGRIRPHRGPCLALLSSVLLTRKLKVLVFLTSRVVLSGMHLYGFRVNQVSPDALSAPRTAGQYYCLNQLISIRLKYGCGSSRSRTEDEKAGCSTPQDAAS